MEKIKRIVIEILLLLIIPFFLALIYNTVSPAGLRILPRKEINKTEIGEKYAPVSAYFTKK